MPKRFLAVNVLLGALVLVALGYIGWELARPARSVPVARPRPGAPAGVPALAAPTAAEPAPGNWTVIANRNLFSPSRSEAPTATVPGVQLANLPKPFLYGIVLKNGAPIAYLEDPVTKRVSAYRVGDTVAGATLTSIARDHVVLARPEGMLDVRLRDPNKPQVALPVAPGVVPGLAPVIPGTPQPIQPPVFPGPGQAIDPRQPVRRIPPNLIRRLPQLPQGQPGGQPAEDQNQQ